MKQKAFTLIELLVVIAIIAILAAILFPVFAQAKLAAKKIASVSNCKEIALAEIMYQGDYDDYFVLSSNATYGSPVGGMTAQIAASTQVNTWVYMVEPYIKNFGIFVDPAVGDTKGLIGGALGTRFNQDLNVQYGYNYEFLSPWYECVSGLGRSSSAAIHPANTVMFTSSQGFDTTPNQGWYAAIPPGVWLIESPASVASCIWWSGDQGSGNWSGNNPANSGYFYPQYAGSSRGKIYNNGVVTSWVDGHAKFQTNGALAAGTDYGTASYNNANSGATVLGVSKTQTTAPSNYVWTLDGTINDIIIPGPT